MPETPGPCLRQQELNKEVQGHLRRIAELMRDIADAMANNLENLVTELDKQVDLEFGLKERGMGALHEHRKEHGC